MSTHKGPYKTQPRSGNHLHFMYRIIHERVCFPSHVFWWGEEWWPGVWGRVDNSLFFIPQTFDTGATAQHLIMPYGRSAGHLDDFIVTTLLHYLIVTSLKTIIHALKLHSLSSPFLLNDSSIIVLLLKWMFNICRWEMPLHYITTIFPIRFPSSASRWQEKGRIFTGKKKKKQLLRCRIHSHTHSHKKAISVYG